MRVSDVQPQEDHGPQVKPLLEEITGFCNLVCFLISARNWLWGLSRLPPMEKLYETRGVSGFYSIICLSFFSLPLSPRLVHSHPCAHGAFSTYSALQSTAGGSILYGLKPTLSTVFSHLMVPSCYCCLGHDLQTIMLPKFMLQPWPPWLCEPLFCPDKVHCLKDHLIYFTFWDQTKSPFLSSPL